MVTEEEVKAFSKTVKEFEEKLAKQTAEVKALNKENIAKHYKEIIKYLADLIKESPHCSTNAVIEVHSCIGEIEIYKCNCHNWKVWDGSAINYTRNSASGHDSDPLQEEVVKNWKSVKQDILTTIKHNQQKYLEKLNAEAQKQLETLNMVDTFEL